MMQNKQGFNAVNEDEIIPSCQIFIDGKEQITFDNLEKYRSFNKHTRFAWLVYKSV